MADFKLPNKTVIVKPIIKSTYMIPDTNHIAAFLARGSFNDYGLRQLDSNGNYVNPFTKEEKEFFEDSSRSGLAFEYGDLSIYGREGENYWDDFQIKLQKDPVTLDLNNPMDYIKYKVLLTNTKEICPSYELINTKATYKYYIEDEQQLDLSESNAADVEERAWEIFGEVKGSHAKMADILYVYGKGVAENSTDDFLKRQLRALIKQDFERFVRVCDDPSFHTSLLIQKAIRVGAIKKSGTAYMTEHGDKIADGIRDTVLYIDDPKNQEFRFNLEQKVDGVKKAPARKRKA